VIINFKLYNYSKLPQTLKWAKNSGELGIKNTS